MSASTISRRPRFLLGLGLASVEMLAGAQAQSLSQGPHRMEVSMDLRENSAWRPVDPGFVFRKDDRIRFRLRANFSGYLYVMNQGTSGQYTLLFPREETGRGNQIKPGSEYRVPATETAFRVAGPPGYDIVYWLVSPIALDSGAGFFPLPSPQEGKRPATLIPRCDDAIFRARGQCIDSSAGPKNIHENETLPKNLSGVPRLRSRELVIVRQQSVSVISSPAPLQGPVLYEFRVAHK